MTIDPTQGPGFRRIPIHPASKSENINPKLQNIVNELDHLMKAYEHDLGAENEPGSLVYMFVHGQTGTAAFTDKYADIKNDLNKLHIFLNDPQNHALLESLGESRGWSGGGGLMGQTVDIAINSFNGLWDQFNQVPMDQCSGQVDMIESDLEYIRQMITQQKSS